MQTIELKQKDEGYFFLCRICNQFPKLPLECTECNQWYCNDCQNFLHNKERRGCNCQLDQLELFEPFQQYAFGKLTIRCQICKELVPLIQSKKHLIKCQQQQSNRDLLIDKGFNNFNLIQNSPNQIPCPIKHVQTYDSENIKYFTNLKCQKCALFQLKQNYFSIANLSEDTIIQLQSILFQCKLCLQEGSIFLMRQHHLFCKQELVSCICGLNQKRGMLNKDHIQQCLAEQIIVNQHNNQQITYTINSQLIAFYSQLVQNMHDFQTIVFNKEFQSQDLDYGTMFIY